MPFQLHAMPDRLASAPSTPLEPPHTMTARTMPEHCRFQLRHPAQQQDSAGTLSETASRHAIDQAGVPANLMR